MSPFGNLAEARILSRPRRDGVYSLLRSRLEKSKLWPPRTCSLSLVLNFSPWTQRWRRKCWIYCGESQEKVFASSQQQRGRFCTCIIHGCLINNSSSGGHAGAAWWALIKTFRGETVGVWCLLIARPASTAARCSVASLCGLFLLKAEPASSRLLARRPLQTNLVSHSLDQLLRSSIPAGLRDWIVSGRFRSPWTVWSFRPPTMIGVNSLHSAGRLRSRSLCTVRYGRDFRMMDPFRYPRTPRSRSLKPLVFPDLLGKAQDGQNHPQARKRRKVVKTSSCYFDTSVRHVMCQLIFRNFSDESFIYLFIYLQLYFTLYNKRHLTPHNID